MRADEAKDRIREAFPATPFEGVVTGCRCDECTGIRLDLQGKQWNEVPDKFIDLTCSPTLLEPDAYCAFLPAWMLRALDLVNEEDNNVVTFTVYCLSPYHDEERDDAKFDWLMNRAGLMNASQVHAVQKFLLAVADQSPDQEWLAPFIRRAREEVWK